MMNWQQLISNKRLGQEHKHPERHDDRTEFKRDYDRLIFSAPFRRLQNKSVSIAWECVCTQPPDPFSGGGKRRHVARQ